MGVADKTASHKSSERIVSRSVKWILSIVVEVFGFIVHVVNRLSAGRKSV